jgi:TIR domain
MADVFISYAKADRPLALKLAAMLEAEGWKVWWDTSLTIGDDFRNEIMTELAVPGPSSLFGLMHRLNLIGSVQRLGEPKLTVS